jgi:oligopeptide/dipeptide ABC transporter ATP-binding protein
MTAKPALLSLDHVSVTFDAGGGWFGPRAVLKAVTDVSFDVHSGETLAVVGESGCGKTTLGRAILGLYPLAGGSVRHLGEDVGTDRSPAMARARRAIQMIFQDPYGSLNPRLPISKVIEEPLEIHGIGDGASRRARAQELITQVGLPVDALNRYPHQFSGGQRQRVAIARALGLEPQLIIADEPLSALDVSIQSQILNLMMALKQERGLSYLFISHDLAAVHHIADRVAVMYLGRIVEIGGREEVFGHSRHPYTQALLDAVPKLGTAKRARGRALSGDVPSPLNPPRGCAFHPRCPKAQKLCQETLPVLSPDLSPHRAACHFPD